MGFPIFVAVRYETAEEWLLVLEQADRRELSLRPRPLLEREPLKVWQASHTTGRP